jgi:hypothetical protein
MADETKSDLTPEQMAARIAELEGQLGHRGSETPDQRRFRTVVRR